MHASKHRIQMFRSLFLYAFSKMQKTSFGLVKRFFPKSISNH